MKKTIKRTVSIILCAVLAACCCFGLAGCSDKTDAKYDVVMITDGQTISDSSYNESAWNGIKAYCDANNLTYRYYQPSTDEDGNLDIEVIKNYFELAANAGAKYIVLPGDSFSVAVHEYAATYKDINFLLVDAFEKSADGVNSNDSNVMCVDFDELQAGFLAGYSCVIDGYKKLGYFGSVDSDTSGDYGAGFVQGAAYAADSSSVPVTLDYADYDSKYLDYDYTVNIKPVYEKVPTDTDDEYFTVKVKSGIGSGTYKEGDNVTVTADAPEKGKVFDHWEVKSDTDGVKDSKVNISSEKKSTMNLLVEKCDCTITAVYSDADTVAINVNVNGKVSDTLNVTKDSTTSVTAPAAQNGYVFDHWEASDQSIFSDSNSAVCDVTVKDKDVDITAVYTESEDPTFDIVVENGTGSGSYRTGDVVNIVANAPEDGMMFVRWENVDNQGLAAGISFENEYSYVTSFEMVDRFASVAEKMIDSGDEVIFSGGNPLADSVFTAGENFDFQTYAYTAGNDQSSRDDCWASVVLDYNKAVELALKSYKGGTIFKADCSNECIYVTNKSINKDDETYNKDYAQIYSEIADGKIKLINVKSGADVRQSFTSKCLSLNYWIKDGNVVQEDAAK